MYIYTWQDRRYNAIKIGYSPDPKLRQLNYAVALGLSPVENSLRTLRLQKGTKGRDILLSVHAAAHSLGLESVRGLDELYGLKNQHYDYISSLLLRAAEVAEREWRLEVFGPEPEARQGDRAKQQPNS